ncbi:2-succinyl-5-enolpyruvyl-6-hydroxy-3-cyclohexene-1-carboxylic-acid synthase [Prochlorococcus sp. MIT 1223]|uniref:2-succinyl-5-enolpyruvyl-6-hydroxy-3- cyclohexene-1-carboxylic-acid synthase n=1 Tax=Prochlorococcus sp. MIT 1223 TaxID=3096217 RepID=UPI002A75A135|nr:2-succinyl-5-enolpyruvyl-6-hydroxy-3-cyclohexene-1-carboxylic-acid synthase [Prochlorococcus sp. MIT 1223]
MNEQFCPSIGIVTSFPLSIARSNLFASIKLLQAFIANGLKYIVICPGSRSGPLAIAAGGLAEKRAVNLITSVDERSAAFLGLGISKGIGKASMVITTSGTAVANLLPAAVEADRSSQPLIFLTADRPLRLKNCGANQTVNQEDFLSSVCRSLEEGPAEGIHCWGSHSQLAFVNRAWEKAHNHPGPVHCNIPIEEPLYASFNEQQEAWSEFDSQAKNKIIPSLEIQNLPNSEFSFNFNDFDPFSSGIIIAGPWRGLAKDLPSFQEALKRYQLISGWPIFADPLSGIDITQAGLVYNWELLIDSGFLRQKDGLNILRLGPLPSSRVLENWLKRLNRKQIIITEGDKRYLDPLGIAQQYSFGLINWVKEFLSAKETGEKKTNISSKVFFDEITQLDSIIDLWINKKLHFESQISEPLLAKWIAKLLPKKINIMLSSSTPIRDWISFSGKESFSRRCFGLRGASGIDGTLSMAMGLAIANGPIVLVTGDLALVHDSNGWLFSSPLKPPLIVLLIDNGGGGIFSQLDINKLPRGDFENLFSMPQNIDHLRIASAHDIPYRQVSTLEDLKSALEWGLYMNEPILLRVCTNVLQDKKLRIDLRSGLNDHLNSIIQNKAHEH